MRELVKLLSDDGLNVLPEPSVKLKIQDVTVELLLQVIVNPVVVAAE